MIEPIDTEIETPPTINETIAGLQHALRDYIEATYHISDPGLVAQRKAVLEQEGVIYRKPFLESTARYETGAKFAGIDGLNGQVAGFLTSLSQKTSGLKQLLYDPPYTHQSLSLREAIVELRSLIVMTGTGSGKTESFLLPILAKLAGEAIANPDGFKTQSGVRALVLYPMNALVDDQLGRLRLLFGDPRVAAQFTSWAGRPIRFARYTSRTLYPGVRDPKRDHDRLAPIENYYVHHLNESLDPSSASNASSSLLVKELKARGKWPSKPDLLKWFGKSGQRWFDKKTETFLRCVTLPEDRELWTRHEVHAAPPDVLVTNYSMLEYMLMRPLERGIFDETRQWLASSPEEKLLLVLDEAHLYRGAGGSEVALLIRRLTQRLGISPARLQVICTTASFEDKDYAPHFAAQLTGKHPNDFRAIKGSLLYRSTASKGNTQDAVALASLHLPSFYSSDLSVRAAEAEKITAYLGKPCDEDDVEGSLYLALLDYPPLCELINVTMHNAQPIDSLANEIFPNVDQDTAERAVTSLLALGSVARKDKDEPGLLPCRIHALFRGLPGLWICMDPTCTVRTPEKDAKAGKLYSQPMELCDCGSRVLELFTCRHCGTMYARAYTDDLQKPDYLWSAPGEIFQSASGLTQPLQALDILLEEPDESSEDVQAAEYDLLTGRLNPPSKAERRRIVYIKKDRTKPFVDDSEDEPVALVGGSLGEFRPCAKCNQQAAYGKSSVQDHQTKGDQPFQAVVTKQIQIQPPGPAKATKLAPLRGRKVLIFSDSRQMAARLAPNIQKYSTQDALRPLICEGFAHLQSIPELAPTLSLDDLFLAVLLSAKRLDVRLRPELKGGELFSEEGTVEDFVKQQRSGDEYRYLQLEMRTASAPDSLFASMLKAFNDRFTGLEALGLASLVERTKRAVDICSLPTIKGFAESDAEKLALARLWIRQWQKSGFLLKAMPQAWLEGIKSNSGQFRKQMGKAIGDKALQKQFEKDWLPKLREWFCEKIVEKKYKLSGKELSIQVGGAWAYCRTCQTTQRPPLRLSVCFNCGKATVELIDPDNDGVFNARKGYYRESTVAALSAKKSAPISIIAAEHTAQLGTAQAHDVFSKAEEKSCCSKMWISVLMKLGILDRQSTYSHARRRWKLVSTSEHCPECRCVTCLHQEQITNSDLVVPGVVAIP